MPTASRQRRRFERRLRAVWAELSFFARALRVLVRPMAALAVAFAIGTIIERTWGAPPGGAQPRWDEAMFTAYTLLLGEMAAPLPADPWAQAVLYLMPLVGIVFVAEGIIKLGFTVFDKRANAEEWIRIMAQNSRGHVVVCGLGTVGFRVVEELLALDEQVFVIERNADGEFIPRARAMGVEVLIGDARTENLLRTLNITHARSVIIVTDDDLANLEIAMDVRELRADVPIILRLFDQRLAQKVRQTMGIQVSLSTSMVAAPLFASAALDAHVVGTHRVGGQLLLVVELDVGIRLSGRTPSALLREHGLTLVAVSRGGVWRTDLAAEEAIERGDRVHVMVPSHRVAEARALEG
ncbi:MAG: NAD-binding protein [Pseudomonadota bacterium]|nr:NAD-binding protein [Pseudomonadota bacterium]